MLSCVVIEPPESPWASLSVLERKKNGSIRYCIDYRQLNYLTVKDPYPLPHTQDCLDELLVFLWFLTLDLQSGYWQIGVQPEDRAKTAFVSRSVMHQLNMMPFGLTNVPGMFERLMEKFSKGLQCEICLVYLDNITCQKTNI